MAYLARMEQLKEFNEQMKEFEWTSDVKTW